MKPGSAGILLGARYPDAASAELELGDPRECPCDEQAVWQHVQTDFSSNANGGRLSSNGCS